MNIYPKESIENVGKEFCRILREARKGLKLNSPVFCSERWVTPTKPLHFEDVKRYLEVYDRRKEGKKWREIAKIVHPKKEWDRSVERALYTDRQNAERKSWSGKTGQWHK